MGTWKYEERELGQDLTAVKNSFNRFTDLLAGPLCGWPEASITTVANELNPGRVPDLLMTRFAAATDVALFYYVGHGLLSDDEEVQLCLGLTGTVKDPRRVVPTSLLYSAVRRALLRSPARTKLVILDCCHSGIALPPRLGQPGTAAAEAVPEELLDETGVERTYVLVAASRKYAYYEENQAAELPQTFFTKYLADLVERGIDDGPPELTMEMLFRRLRASLQAGGHSRPAARGDSGGDYPFCRNATRMPGPAPVSRPPTAEGDPPLTLLAEWALWGMDEHSTGYHVMRCSEGDLTAEHFSEIITRYGSGVKPSLPQYTVCRIPDPQGSQEFLAVAVHEVIDLDSPSAGGRSRNVGGRVVEYVRLFCFRYADVAEFGASYTDLVKALADIPLVPGGVRADLVPVELPPAPEPTAPAHAERELAADVAVMLLTGSPVCVLDADGVPAERRLAFIDLVMSLLPFGLRATLSASTSASTTMVDLKLRLYFSNAPREDGGRTSHVSWTRPAAVKLPQSREAARLYREWLSEAGPGAIENLALKTAPVRFTEAELQQMCLSLPKDRSVADTLAELDDRLRAADQKAISAIVKRLQRYLAGPQDPADRAVLRSLILKYGLFREHPGMHSNVKSSVYRVLLRAGFATPLTYASYCEIEDSAGVPLSLTLRKVLLNSRIYVLSFVLAAVAGPGVGPAELADALAAQHIGTGLLLDILEQRDMDAIRPQHRGHLIDFTVWYLLGYAPAGQQEPAEDPRAEVSGRGYLTGLLQRAFPDDQAEQQHRLADIFRYVHGKRLGQEQIREIFEAPRLYPGPALEATVRRMALPRQKRFADRQAAAARLRYAGHAEDVTQILRPVLSHQKIGHPPVG